MSLTHTRVHGATAPLEGKVSTDGPSAPGPSASPTAYQDTYFSDHRRMGAFREALRCACSSRSSTSLVLSGFPHWDALVQGGVIPKGVAYGPLCVKESYFYGMSGYPSFEELPGDVTLWTNCRLAWVMAKYPGLPKAFRFIPGPVEGVVSIEGEEDKGDDPLETTLRSSMGGRNFRELRRAHKWATAAYGFSVHCAEDVHPYLDTVAELHQHHADKHGNGINIFNRRVLDAFYHSPLRTDLILGLRRDKSPKEIVQVLWGYRDQRARCLYILSQAKSLDLGRTPGNLLQEGLYQMYLHWLPLGYRSFNVGRGTSQDRQYLGANQLYQQGHYLFLPDH